jgi:hypothetical protein
MYVSITISVHMWCVHFLTITVLMNDICSVHIRPRFPRSSRTSLGYTSCTVWGPSGVCHGTATENSMGFGKMWTGNNWNWCTIPFSEILQLLQAPVASILLEGFSFTGQWSFFWSGATAPGPNSLISPALIHSSAQAMNNWISGCIYVCMIMFDYVPSGYLT